MKSAISKQDLKTRNAAICREFSKGGVTKVALARKFGVDERTIRRVLSEANVPSKVVVRGKKPLKSMLDNLSTTTVKTSVKVGSNNSVTNQALSVKDQMANGGQDVQYIITNDSVILTYKNSTEIVDQTHKGYEEIKVLISQGKFKEALLKMNIAKAITEYSNGLITIKNGKLSYGELEVHNSLTDRILALMDEGDNSFKGLLNMLTRLLDNPSKRSVDELWGFLKNTDIEITEDGYLVCWKLLTKVGDKVYDTYTQRVPNEIGYKVSMPRFMVNGDANQTCSQGLHVCSWGYLRHYKGNIIHKVLVNPADVVSIPTDYSNQKMRVAEYVNIAQVDSQKNVVSTKVASPAKHIVVGQQGEILSETLL